MSATNSTGWVARNYNSRGLITHNMPTRNLVRTSNGVLWAAIRENIQSKYIRIYRSITNGFSWDLMWHGTFTSPGFRFSGVAGLNTNGPIMHLMVDERRNRMVLLHSFYNTAPNPDQYQVEPFIFKLTTDDRIERIDPAPGTPSLYNLIDVDMDQMAMQVSQNDDYIWMTYMSYSQLELTIMRSDEPIVATAITGPSGSDYFNVHATNVTDNNELDVLLVEDRNSQIALTHVRYEKNSNLWSAQHDIAEFQMTNIYDVNLERDGNGTLCAAWSQFNTAGTSISIYYSLSYDNGSTWESATQVPKTSGHIDFIDSPTGQYATRLNVLGLAEGGFIFTYVRSVSSVDMCYWRRLSYSAGVYTLGTELELASNCSGAKFFKATSTTLFNGTEAENIRVGYVIGQGNSTVQSDNKPVSLRSKTLSEGLDTTSDAYIEDSAAANQLAVAFNILGSPNDNVDYYAEGLTGSTTTKYINALNKIGTTIRMYKYEPDENSYMDDRTAYLPAEEYSSKAVFSPINYSLPVSQANELFTTYMERDTRKIYLPPTFHLSRTFTLNKGQNLKRTVWTAAFDGNIYELTQVVPFFLNSEIAYYSANAYVIGPSNDPFARTILPTET